ncbi:MAG: hypothetical protein ACOYI5_03765 [Christensenellales bacterium]
MRRWCKALIVLPLLMLAIGCRAQETGDAMMFKQEHEILNGQYNLDGSHIYQSIEVPPDNHVIYAELLEVLDLIDAGSGVIYFGFPECPWCRTLVPVLFEAIAEAGYEGDVYYCNFLDERDRMSLGEDGEIVVDQPGSEAYARLVEVLYDHLGPYNGLNDDAIKRVYFPTTVFVKDGEVTGVHLVTVEGQESGYDALTEEQHAELLRSLTADIQALMQ